MALANPHWPAWAARELAQDDPFSLIPEDRAWWLHALARKAPWAGRRRPLRAMRRIEQTPPSDHSIPIDRMML